MDVVLLLLALVGHASIWIAAVNRTHSFGWRRFYVQWVTALLFVALGLPPLGLVWWLIHSGGNILDAHRAIDWSRPGSLALLAYLAACWVAGARSIRGWLRRRLLHQPPGILRFHRTRSMEVQAAKVHSKEYPHHFLVHLPRNEILQLDLTERVIDVPRLPPALDGLSIVHMSDFHFTGHVGKAYFHEVVRLSNELDPDLVAITGDLVDRAACIDWIPETLGRLKARHGVYVVLGNHDIRVDKQRLLDALRAGGLVYLGGRWIEIEIRNQRVVLSGNELPWFRPAADMGDCPPREGGPLRIALAHSPDQLPWARRSDVDLLLAGHTHGGQILLPWLGPIFAPSRGGVTYASGIFHAPPTILHVTRGVSGELPVRLNCPPEMALLRLSMENGGSPDRSDYSNSSSTR